MFFIGKGPPYTPVLVSGEEDQARRKGKKLQEASGISFLPEFGRIAQNGSVYATRPKKTVGRGICEGTACAGPLPRKILKAVYRH